MDLTNFQLKSIVKQLNEFSIEKERKIEEKKSIRRKNKHLKRFEIQIKKEDFVKDTIMDMLSEGFDEDEGLDEYNNISMLYHLKYDIYEKLKITADKIDKIINEIDLKK